MNSGARGAECWDLSGDGGLRRGSRLSSWGEVVRKDECRVLAECYDGGRQREEAFLAIPHHSPARQRWLHSTPNFPADYRKS